MFTELRRAIAPVLLLLLTLPAIADDLAGESDEATRSIHLKSGTVIVGKVIELTDEAIVVEFEGVPGSRGSVARSAIVPSDLFGLMLENRDPKTAEAWMALAKAAGDLGLHNDRMWSLRNAARLMPGHAEEIEKDIEACRQECSKQRLGMAREFLEAGELDRARRYLRIVLVEYSGCVAGTEANDLLKRITDDIEREKARASAVLAERRRIQEGHEDLQSVRNLMERGEDALRVGRESLERPGAAISRFDETLALLERGWILLGRFSAPASASPGLREELVSEVGRLKGALRDDMVAVHLELGHAYLTRSGFVRATAHAGAAAALDPEDSGVLALRTAIAAARAGRSR